MTRLVFGYTGGVQTFIVPDQCTTIFVEATGAGSASHLNDKSQDGGFSSGHLAVTPGEVLYLYVGGSGSVPFTSTINHPRGGFNGGGVGGRGTAFNGGSGGGASDVRQGGSALSNRKVVAGGAGGFSVQTLPAELAGGVGGADTGGQGSGGTAQGSGLGGTQSAGGASGTGGQAGSLGQGGNSPVVSGQAYAPAGGGGGYYGGGSGFLAGTSRAGGGGSNYIGGVTGGVSTAGAGPHIGSPGQNPADRGTIALTFNLAPSKPAVTTPQPYFSVDVAMPLGFAFFDVDPGDTMSRADVRWRPASTTAWTELDSVTVASVGINNVYTFAANFAAGFEGTQLEFQVRTYDLLGAIGPWSDSVYATPMTPTMDAEITVPAQINTQNPVFQLKRTGGGQFFEARVQCWTDSGGAPGVLACEIYFNPGTAQTLLNFTWDTSNADYTVSVPGFQLSNLTNYHFLAQLSSPANVFSEPAADSGVVEVVINTPEAAAVIATALPGNAPPAIRLDITNPSSGDPFPASYNDIYRTDLSTGTRLRIATGLTLSTSYTDFLVGLSTSYQYDVVPVYVAP